MNIQIIGTKKCNETRKAVRFFQERGQKAHFVDLNERPLSPGELDGVLRKFPAEELIDPESASYKKRGLAWMEYNPREELLEDPGLMKTPVVRSEGRVTLGYDPETWSLWLKG